MKTKLKVGSYEIRVFDFAFYLNVPLIMQSLNNIFFILKIENNLTSATLMRAYMVIMLMHQFMYLTMRRNSKQKGIYTLILTLYLLASAYSLIMNPALRSKYYRELIYFIFYVLAPVQLISEVDCQSLQEKMQKYVPLGIITSISQIIVFSRTRAYSMDFSYAIILQTLLCLSLFLNKPSLKYLCINIIYCAAILIAGSRGSILCIIIYMILKIAGDDNTVKRFLFKFWSIISMLLLVIYHQKLLNVLVKVFPSSRTLEAFAHADINVGYGRNLIWEAQIAAIREAPFLFRGIYADRLISAGNALVRGRYAGSSDFWGLYAHNIILEILVDFGIIVGVVFILYILVIASRSFIQVIKLRNHYIRELYYIFFAFAVGQLSFSSSYLKALSFGAFLGIVININMLYKKIYSNPSSGCF